MLYWLLYQKGFVVFHIGPFRIFRYLTFRTAFASLTALFIGLIIGPSVVRRLREFQISQYIREDGPKDHQKKAGTPTMGGVLIVVGMLIPTLLWADLTNRFVWIAIAATLAFGADRFRRRLPEGRASPKSGTDGPGQTLLPVPRGNRDRRSPQRVRDARPVLDATDRALRQAVSA